jgi:hypothetical protein
MATVQLDELSELAPPRVRTRDNSRLDVVLNLAGIAFALVAYAAATWFILSHSMAKVYGFPVFHDVRTLIEVALRACPMLAAIFMVLISGSRNQLTDRLAGRIEGAHPASNRRTRETIAIIAVNSVLAVLFLAITALVLLTVCGSAVGAPGPLTLLWVAAEFTVDVVMIGIFTTVLYALTRRVWLSFLLFAAYIAAVVLAGREWGITSYIGFASGVPVMLTTYSAIPLYDGAGWLFRGYWACVSIFLLSFRHVFSRPDESLLRSIVHIYRFRKQDRPPSLGICVAALLVSIGAGAFLVGLQSMSIAKYLAGTKSSLAAQWRAGGDESRFHLDRFDIHLRYEPRREAVAVDGVLTFVNGRQPIGVAYFQVPTLMDTRNVRISGVGAYRLQRFGKYMEIKFARPLEPGSQARLAYSDTIRPAGPFDLTAQAKVLRNAFFLTDSDFLFAARSAQCLGSSEPQNGKPAAAQTCGAGENYLMSDMAAGVITVSAPSDLSVVGLGEETVLQLAGGMSEHVFNIRTPRLATFMMACARFIRRSALSNDGRIKVDVYGSPAAANNGGLQASLAADILSFYDTVWPAYPRSELQIIETPTPLGEAVAFDGTVAITDKIISSRDPVSGLASHLLEFVMAHEIAHQWWGYRVIPAKLPGRLFLLESFPQYAAYKYLFSRKILDSQEAVRNESRRYERALARLGQNDVPLARIEAANEVAYNKGPYVLLSLDRLSGGVLMNRLSDLLNEYDWSSHGKTVPEQFLSSIVKDLPERERQKAQTLLYTTETSAAEHRRARPQTDERVMSGAPQ